MTVGRFVRRGARYGARWWWQQARPAYGGNLAGRGEARPLHEAGRPPTPDERWTPTIPASGPWTNVEPHTAGRWPRGASMLMVAAWGAAVAVRVLRDLRH